MQTSTWLSCLLSTLMGAHLAAQAPPGQAPPAQPAPVAQPAPKPPVHRRPATPAAPVTMTITVTDKTGNPVPDMKITASGDVQREATTTAGGVGRFLTVKPGEDRLRFEHDGFVTLERDVTVKGGAPLDLEVAVTAAPPPPKPPPPPPTSVNAPPGDARALVIADFADSNRLGSHDPMKSDQLGCTASAKTSLIQIKDAVPERALSDADEVIYVVAGAGTLRLGNKDVSLEASTIAIVPRGTVRGLSRSGNKPLILLSVISGPPCTSK